MCAAAVQSLAHCSSLTITKKDKLNPNRMGTMVLLMYTMACGRPLKTAKSLWLWMQPFLYCTKWLWTFDLLRKNLNKTCTKEDSKDLNDIFRFWFHWRKVIGSSCVIVSQEKETPSISSPLIFSLFQWWNEWSNSEWRQSACLFLSEHSPFSALSVTALVLDRDTHHIPFFWTQIRLGNRAKPPYPFLFWTQFLFWWRKMCKAISLHSVEPSSSFFSSSMTKTCKTFDFFPLWAKYVAEKWDCSSDWRTFSEGIYDELWLSVFFMHERKRGIAMHGAE